MQELPEIAGKDLFDLQVNLAEVEGKKAHLAVVHRRQEGTVTGKLHRRFEFRKAHLTADLRGGGGAPAAAQAGTDQHRIALPVTEIAAEIDLFADLFQLYFQRRLQRD